jgi:regulator of protease activity HflC (stomatin/prohibitin superfamily)
MSAIFESVPYLIVLAVLVFVSSAVRILFEYQRGVIFTSTLLKVKGPGLIIVIPSSRRWSGRPPHGGVRRAYST